MIIVRSFCVVLSVLREAGERYSSFSVMIIVTLLRLSLRRTCRRGYTNTLHSQCLWAQRRKVSSSCPPCALILTGDWLAAVSWTAKCWYGIHCWRSIWLSERSRVRLWVSLICYIMSAASAYSYFGFKTLPNKRMRRALAVSHAILALEQKQLTQ